MLTITAINAFSSLWASVVWRAAWQGGVALILVFVICRTLRKIPANVQCWLWRLALLKLLVTGLWVAPLELPWLPPQKPAVVSAKPLSVAMEDSNPAPFAPKSLPSADGPLAPIPKAAAGLSVVSGLLLVWMLGVTILLANLLRRWLQIRRIISGLAKVTDAPVLERVVENCQKMSVRRPPDVRISPNGAGPFLVGVFKPVIVLPADLVESCSDGPLNIALAHELAHIRRRDLLWNWLPALAEAVFFFHPLVWLANRQWRLAQEIATDELAVSSSRIDVARYARSLIELAEQFPTCAWPRFGVGVTETYSHLSRRILAMKTFGDLTTGHRTMLIATMLAVVGLVPWKLTAQRASDASSPEISTDEPAQTDPPQNRAPRMARTMTIRVVGPDGKPMQGVKVFRNHVFQPLGQKRPRIENKVYWTDAKGKAVIVLSGTPVDLRIWASKANFVPLHAMWAKKFQSDGDQIPEEFTFRLQRGTQIGGIVKNEQGEPIQGVKIAVQDMTAGRSPLPSKPGIRPERSRWLAEGEVVTDAQGRWKLTTVPRDKILVYPKSLKRAGITPPPKIALRLRHPDYVSEKEWGKLQREQGVTLKSLRNQTAVIVMKKRSGEPEG